MNINAYIESGIVATYVLGLATEAEQKEFENLCTQYPELMEAKRSFEITLEDRLINEAVTIPAELKKKVLRSLNNPVADNLHQPEKEYKAPVRKMNVWKLAGAACLLLLAGSVYFTYVFREKYQRLEKENIGLKNGFKKSAYTNPIMAIDPIVNKSSVKWSAMIEPKNSSHCMAHIYWDSVSAKTFLLVGNIPKAVSDKQLQLWALQDKHAVNLGILDSKQQGELVQMKNVQKAKKFIITIEQKGGSFTPSMGAIYAVSKL